MKKIVICVPLSLAIAFSPYTYASLTIDASSRGVDQSVQQFSANQEVTEVLFVDQNGNACRLSKENGAAQLSLPSELYSLSNEVSELSSVQECDNSTTQTALVIAGDAYHPQSAGLQFFLAPIAFAASCAIGAASIALKDNNKNLEEIALGIGGGAASLGVATAGMAKVGMTLGGSGGAALVAGAIGLVASLGLICRGVAGGLIYIFKK